MDSKLQTLYDIYDPGEEHLPVELLNDPHHPGNDQFEKSVVTIQRNILAARNRMKPKQREAVQLYHSGLQYVTIADKLGISPQTASNYVNSNKGQRLLSLFNHLQAKLDGPTTEHRKGILYRIAIDNEKDRPNIAVNALQELNKMAGSYETPGNNQNGLHITINNELLPSGKLDELPPTHIIEHQPQQVTDDSDGT